MSILKDNIINIGVGSSGFWEVQIERQKAGAGPDLTLPKLLSVSISLSVHAIQESLERIGEQ